MTQSIADNLVLPVLDRISGADGLIPRQKKLDLIAKWIKDLAIKIGKPEDPVATLSGGNQQREVLAKWLLGANQHLATACSSSP